VEALLCPEKTITDGFSTRVLLRNTNPDGTKFCSATGADSEDEASRATAGEAPIKKRIASVLSRLPTSSPLPHRSGKLVQRRDIRWQLERSE